MTQQPQASSVGAPGAAGPSVAPGPTRLLALVTAGLGIVVYLLGFFGDLRFAVFVGALLVGGGLLVGASVLPNTGRVLVPGAVAVTTGTLLLLQFVTAGGSPVSAVIAMVVAFLQTVTAVGAVLLDAGIVTAPAPRPARPPAYGPGAGGFPQGYGQPGGYGGPGGAAGHYGQPGVPGQQTPGAPGLPFGAGQSGPQPNYGVPGRPQPDAAAGYGQSGGYGLPGSGAYGAQGPAAYGAPGAPAFGAPGHGAQPGGYEPQPASQSWGQQPPAPSAAAATNAWYGDNPGAVDAGGGSAAAPGSSASPRTAVYQAGDSPAEPPAGPPQARQEDGAESAEGSEGAATRSIRPGELRPPD